MTHHGVKPFINSKWIFATVTTCYIINSSLQHTVHHCLSERWRQYTVNHFPLEPPFNDILSIAILEPTPKYCQPPPLFSGACCTLWTIAGMELSWPCNTSWVVVLLSQSTSTRLLYCKANSARRWTTVLLSRPWKTLWCSQLCNTLRTNAFWSSSFIVWHVILRSRSLNTL